MTVTLADLPESDDERRERIMAEWVHPAPEVPKRPARREDLTASAIRLGQKAKAAGFAVKAFYSKGTSWPRWLNGVYSGKTVENVVLKGYRERDGVEHRFIVIYENGKPAKHHYWMTGPILELVNVTEIGRRL